MIEVSIDKEHIRVSGHARAAPAGQDIVCAAISALVDTLICSLTQLTEDEIKLCISPGRVDIEYKDLSGEAKTLVDSFFIGACRVADGYPGYIRIM